MNNFPPTVFANDANVQLGSSIPFHVTFDVSDLDPDSEVVRYRFKDLNTLPQSGFFSVKGDNKTQGVAFEIDAALIFEVNYNAAPLISSEAVSIEVFDGEFWSQIAFSTMFSVQPNLNIPIVNATDFSVMSTETIKLGDVIDAFDIDGYPIEYYMVVDRMSNPNGGYFTLRGEILPSATWNVFSAEDLPYVKYVGGQFGQTETLGIRARDEQDWSDLTEFAATTLPNLNDPNIDAVDSTVMIGETLSIQQMYNFSDLDGNTMKKLFVTDLGASGSSGYFEFDGVQISANVKTEFDVNDLDKLFYVSGSVIGTEQFMVQAWDGRRLSTNSVGSADTIGLPEIEVTEGIYMLDELELLQLNTIIDVTPGPSVLYYDLLDTNDLDTSGKFYVNGQTLEAHQVHRITANDFQNAFVQGGKSDLGRSFDEFLVRADNGFGVSKWTGVNVSTDPVNQDALLQIGEWTYPTERLELTYNFPTIINPFYCQNGFDECNDFIALTDPDQRAAIRDIFSHYETIIDAQFTEVSSVPGSRADIEFYNRPLDGDGGLLAYAYVPGIKDEFDFRGDIFGDGTDALMFESFLGGVGYATWIHELGHSFGLDHPFFQGPQGIVDKLPPPMQNNRYTIMSYNRVYNEEPITPQLYDVMALQTLYGANMDYNTGDTQIRAEEINSILQFTIWDAGGWDTLNFQGHTTDNTLDLRQGQHSSIGGREENVTIAWGVDVEGGRGGFGNDVLIGNELNNILWGNEGADVLRGNGGNDVLRGGANNDRYEIQVGDGWDIINENKLAGRDTLDLHFAERTPALENDVTFRLLGRDLRIDLTLDVGRANGGITVKDQVWGGSRIETLRLFGNDGEQIGPDISILSITAFADNSPQRFVVTDNTSKYGNLAVPV